MILNFSRYLNKSQVWYEWSFEIKDEILGKVTYYSDIHNIFGNSYSIKL